ncbi:RNA polymerase sigma factor [Spirosoma sp. SC4-14]|uniref:RNA polymerase sigma factor n=1 Tax=Spirosoma sp. SC4-14 TaxID=3128900 RepID=UPI0030D55A11
MAQNSLTGKLNDQDAGAVSFETIYKQYVRKVYQKCLSMTKDSTAAQDYTQDIFLKAFAKLDSFKNQASFSTWLYSIAHNYCLDQIRLTTRSATERLEEQEYAIGPDDKLESTDYKLQQLERLLDQLSADEVMLLRLKHEHGLSIKQLSQRYELSESAIKMRLKRSRDKLISLYRNQYAD